MKELLTLLSEAERLDASQTSYALATVVHIDGASYRRPGARMLIDPEGQTWGTISGGCLEGEVARQALTVMETGKARLLPFQLGDDDVILGFGTGCDGIVHVFIEPVPAGDRLNPAAVIRECMRRRGSGVLATVLDASGPAAGRVGTHFFLGDDGAESGSLVRSSFAGALRRQAERILDDDLHGIRRAVWQNVDLDDDGGRIRVLFEVVRPPVRLVVFGDGHDVRPVVRIASELGWRVAVVGRKPVEVLTERFPEAAEAYFLMHPEELGEHVPLDPWSATLVMNHNFQRDRTLLQTLLGLEIAYVGMLGPYERTRRMLDEIASMEPSMASERMERVYGPIGLDIGTETPEEIALSVVAEVQSVLHRRAGRSLKLRAGRIHEPAEAL